MTSLCGAPTACHPTISGQSSISARRRHGTAPTLRRDGQSQSRVTLETRGTTALLFPHRSAEQDCELWYNSIIYNRMSYDAALHKYLLSFTYAYAHFTPRVSEPQTVTAVDRRKGTVIVTLAGETPFRVGEKVRVQGLSDPSLNVSNVSLASICEHQFTYADASPNAPDVRLLGQGYAAGTHCFDTLELPCPETEDGYEMVILEADHPWGPKWRFVAREPYFGAWNGYQPDLPTKWMGRVTGGHQEMWMAWAANDRFNCDVDGHRHFKDPGPGGRHLRWQ